MINYDQCQSVHIAFGHMPENARIGRPDVWRHTLVLSMSLQDPNISGFSYTLAAVAREVGRAC